MVMDVLTLLRKNIKKQGKESVFAQKLKKSHYRAANLERSSTVKKQKKIIPLSSLQKLIKIVLLGTLLLSGGYYMLTGPGKILYSKLNYFRINEIEIIGCRFTTSGGLKKMAGLSYEMNMLNLELQTLEKQILAHPWIKDVEVRKIWPDALHIRVTEYRPNALVVDKEEHLQYLDFGGVIFTSVLPGQDKDFPVITGLSRSWKKVEKQKMLDAASLFLRLAGQNNPNLPAQSVSEIHFSRNGELILYLVEYPFPIYFGTSNIKTKYYQLRKVLETLYRKRKGKSMIQNVAYIRMDYQKNKVLVVKNHAG